MYQRQDAFRYKKSFAKWVIFLSEKTLYNKLVMEIHELNDNPFSLNKSVFKAVILKL